MDHLLQASVRSMLLAAAAALILWRVKSAAVRHAVWTLVTASMLVQIALCPLLPEIPLRVLRPAEPIVIAPANEAVVLAERGPAPGARAALSWEQSASAVYFCGLLFFAVRFLIALIFALRLVRASEPTGQGSYQSHHVAAPLTIGNRILLPATWTTWDAAKLRDVLAHEEAHVRRRDWAIAVMARLNRCVFWFHPLAWWLERQLARLAEQACDDAALAVVEDRDQYARTLLDIARSIRSSNGKLVAAHMAKEANVETRINRILDESRRIPKALGRRGWTGLAVLAAPLMYITAAIQLAPAQTVVAPPPPPPPAAVTIPQPPAPQAAPAPPQPPAAEASPSPQPAQTLGVGGPIFIPKVYNGRNKTFFFYSFDNYLKSQADRPAQAQTPAPDQTPPLRSDLHVEVTSVRLTKISIPLDSFGRYEITGRITTPEGQFVTSFDERVDHRGVLEKELPIKAGMYGLLIFLRNLDGGMITAQYVSFEVE